MQRIGDLHERLQVTIALWLLFLLGAWLVAWWQKQAWAWLEAATGMAILLLLAEALLGVLLLWARPLPNPLHLLYGIIIAATLPATQRYNRQQPPALAARNWAAACAFVLIAVLRAFETA